MLFERFKGSPITCKGRRGVASFYTRRFQYLSPAPDGCAYLQFEDISPIYPLFARGTWNNTRKGVIVRKVHVSSLLEQCAADPMAKLLINDIVCGGTCLCPTDLQTELG